MSDLAWGVFLQLAGVFVIIAEIVLPSGGLLSLLAIGLLGYSLYMVFAEISVAVGMMFVIADLIVIPVLVLAGIKALAASPATLRTRLSRQEGVTAQDPGLDRYRGMRGRTLSDLHPSGTAVIAGDRVDVVSRGEYIDKNIEVQVDAVTGNQIIVKRVE